MSSLPSHPAGGRDWLLLEILSSALEVVSLGHCAVQQQLAPASHTPHHAALEAAGAARR